MRKVLFSFIAILFFASQVNAQELGWKTGGIGTLNFTNTTLSQYWQAGGQNTITIVGLVNLFANNEKERTAWDNNLDMAYGVIRQGKKVGNVVPNFLKNEDRLDFTSKYGYKITEPLRLATLLNFRTQFAPGLKDPLDINSALISDFLAPAYLNWGVGLDYKPNDDFSVYFSPLNAKWTYVGVDSLIGNYMPAKYATDNQNLRTELGAYLNARYRRDIVENISWQTKVDLFTNYLENFGNIDVNWENLFAAQINKYITTSFFTQLLYDDDIKFDIVNEPSAAAKGPRTQFKTVLGVGLVYKMGAAKE